ncbi:hypothetical protein [Nocardia sp. NPDC020380]|uniref:hypothetical protein n=1 Tax=Nocardia sp. NPDC020380 TaxID=3364309 RepID=UPI0037BA15CC
MSVAAMLSFAAAAVPRESAARAVQGHLDPAFAGALTAGLTTGFHHLGLAFAVLSLLGAALTWWALAPPGPS